MNKSKLLGILMAALGGLAVSASAGAAQNYLGYSAWSSVDASLNFKPNSPYLPLDYSVRAQVASAHANGNDLAAASWNLPAGEQTTDFVYNVATNSGQYGYSISGQAQVFGNQLKASIVTTSTDTDWNNPNPNSTYLDGYSYASYRDQWLIDANAKHAAGSYGAIVVTATLDGYFPGAIPDDYNNSASAYVTAQTRFTDSSGVNYTSDFSLSAHPAGSYVSGGAWTQGDWSTPQSVTLTKKLLFQYGTVFDFNMWLQTYSSNNGEADFFNTAKITDILLPFGAELQTGSMQSGLEGVSFGTVRNSTSLTDPNTNWDFGNGGGPIVPEVPEPGSYAMFLAGLGLLGFMAKRRSRA